MTQPPRPDDWTRADEEKLVHAHLLFTLYMLLEVIFSLFL
jgi:hypothetical protein